jgi:hypothetical protein
MLDKLTYLLDFIFSQVYEERRNIVSLFDPLTPNDPYSGRTAPLTSKRCILYIYSTNIGNEYFKRGIYSSLFLFKMQFVS